MAVGVKVAGVVVAVGIDAAAVAAGESGAATEDRVAAVAAGEERCSWVDDDAATAVVRERYPVVEAEAYRNGFLLVPVLRLDRHP